MRAKKSRGSMLLEALAALTLAVVLAGGFALRTASQSVLLRAANEEAHARATLRLGYERLRAGVVAPPGAGEVLALETADGFVLTAARDPAKLDPRLEGKGDLVPVRLTVRWVGADRIPRTRELTTLVASLQQPGGVR
jgi:hypothetical protein